MKKIILLASAVLLAGCLNSSTVFANRSVIHVSTPELIGERASVTGSPTSSDSTVQADKQQQTPVNIGDGQTIGAAPSQAQDAPEPQQK